MTPEEIEYRLRYELWINHSCSSHMPYGDDGEMQCCGIDFVRMPIKELVDFISDKRLESAFGNPKAVKAMSDFIQEWTSKMSLGGGLKK